MDITTIESNTAKTLRLKPSENMLMNKILFLKLKIAQTLVS